MATAPNRLNVALDQIPDAPEWFHKVLESLNPFTQQVSAALRQGITFRENVLSELKLVKFRAPGPVWTSPTLLNGWLDYGGGYGPPAFTTEESGFIQGRGAVKSGTAGSAIAVFPSGPPLTQYFPAIVGSGQGAIAVLPNGTLYSDNSYAASTSYVSLDAVRFRPANPSPPVAPTTNGWPLIVQHSLPTVEEVRVCKVYSPDIPAGSLKGDPRFDWELAEGGVVLRNVYGLVEGRNYEVALRLIAG